MGMKQNKNREIFPGILLQQSVCRWSKLQPERVKKSISFIKRFQKFCVDLNNLLCVFEYFRPPRTIVPNISGINIGTTVGSILDSTPYLPPPPPPPDMLKIEPKARRKFNVPAKYRCRVCHKIYLGDRKMAKHMKAFPTHGPSGKEHFD